MGQALKSVSVDVEGVARMVRMVMLVICFREQLFMRFIARLFRIVSVSTCGGGVFVRLLKQTGSHCGVFQQPTEG
ncbi:hypothetical protein D3C75_1311680 [compost metagenome]